MIVDFKRDFLFNHKVDVTKEASRTLSKNNRNVAKKYIATLQQLVKRVDLHNGIKKATQLINNTKTTPKQTQHYIKKMKTYKTTMNQLMLSAERTATKGKPRIFQWSKTLSTRGQILRYWTKRKKRSEDGTTSKKGIKWPKGYRPKKVDTHDDIMEEYIKAKIEWVKKKIAATCYIIAT